MSITQHIIDEIGELSYQELLLVQKVVNEQIEQYKKVPTYSIPNYSFEEQ